jgi:N-acetylglucosamine-6-phosphate deacetylase
MDQCDVSILVEKGVVISSGCIEEKDVWITREYFSDVPVKKHTTIDARSLTLTPGLIDLQINGFAGREFGHDAKALEEAIVHLPQHGITSFLPTIPTSPLPLYAQKVLQESLRSAQNSFGAQPLGWHFEGPFINREKSGIHPTQYVLETLDVDFWDQLFALNTVALMTFAPESPCAPDLFRLLQKHNIFAAIGHSSPSEKDIQTAYDNGVRLVSHLFNAMPPFHHRDSNLVGSILGRNLFDATIIADLAHVNAEALRVAYNCCQGRLAIVSDGCPLLGSSQKIGRFCGSDIEVRDGGCFIRGTDRLAGSALFLDEQLLRAVQVMNIPFETAIDMVSSMPASYIGLKKSKGKIEAGFDADCVFWEGHTIVATISKGRLVYAQDRFLQRIRG